MARNSRQIRTRSRTRNHRGALGPRVLPWVLLREATELVRERPFDVLPDDRVRLRELVRISGGKGINLSPRERSEVALIVNRAKKPASRIPAPLVGSRRRATRRAR